MIPPLSICSTDISAVSSVLYDTQGIPFGLNVFCFWVYRPKGLWIKGQLAASSKLVRANSKEEKI